MRTIDPEELPISAKPQDFRIDQALCESFYKAFRFESKEMPPTVGVKSLTGMFELLRAFEVDWSKLLHISQKFEYHKNFELPREVRSQAKLIKHRKRAQANWLNFETTIHCKKTNELLMSSISVVMVGE